LDARSLCLRFAGLGLSTVNRRLEQSTGLVIETRLRAEVGLHRCGHWPPNNGRRRQEREERASDFSVYDLSVYILSVSSIAREVFYIIMTTVTVGSRH